MPLPGGPSDKAGNSYERRWTVFALIDLLDGAAEAIRIEVPGAQGAGSEFRLTVGGTAEWHQAKRQRSAGPWTMNALDREGVLSPWRIHLARGDRCVFVSSTSADELRELVERASDAVSWEEFESVFVAAKSVRRNFDRLIRAWGGPPEPETYLALRNIQVRTLGEPELARFIETRLRVCTQGADEKTVAAVLAQFSDDSVHRPLSADDVWRYLAEHKITPRRLHLDRALAQRAAENTNSYIGSLRPLLIGNHELPRDETSTVMDKLDRARRVLVTGIAGVGKSVVVAQVLEQANRNGWPSLALSADRLPDVQTTTQLGASLGLPDSPAIVLAGLAASKNALLVIDQLDAVSVASGRHPERIGLLTELLTETTSYPELRVVLACRRFDVDNDRALRAISSHPDTVIIEVGNLTKEQVTSALDNAGLRSDISEPLIHLLAVPLHLALFVELAEAGTTGIDSARSLTDLYDRFWSMKRDECRAIRGGQDDWQSVIDRLVEQMSDRQEIAVPESTLDDYDAQAKTMASAGVLVVGRGRISFFHETFFDYCFAREFVRSGATLTDLLRSSEQDLFRRSQIRQVLSYTRAVAFDQYVDDLQWLLTAAEVRPHIQMLVISLLDTFSGPTSEEWEVVRQIAFDPDSFLQERLWLSIRRNASWFSIADADNAWTRLLSVGGELANRTLWALAHLAGDYAARVSEVLIQAPQTIWPAQRVRFLSIAEISRSPSRELIDILLEAIADGDFDDKDNELDYILSRLVGSRPNWATEAMAAFYERHDYAVALKSVGTNLGSDIVDKVADGAPVAFVESFLPQLLRAMELHARPEWATTELVPDAVWGYRIYGSDTSPAGRLFNAMGGALAKLATDSPGHASTFFEQLKARPYQSAAVLLALGYIGNPSYFANDAAEWVSMNPGSRTLGYSDSHAWVSHQLIAAVSPLCSQDRLDSLEDALLLYATPYERTHEGLRSRGITELTLLVAIDSDRRSATVEKRIAELQRKFGYSDVPPPQGITGGIVPPPIPEESSRLMTNDQWLGAMRRYDTSETTWKDGKIVGDAWTQAHVLEAITREDPKRFAKLLVELPSETHEAYISAILRGLEEAQLDRDLLLEVCHHSQAIGTSDTNRWLARLIAHQAPGVVDDSLLHIVSDLARNDPDPEPTDGERVGDAEDIDMLALNSTRGAAAHAIGQLLSEEPNRLNEFEPSLRQLACDPVPAVRAAAIGALVPLLYTRPDMALRLFEVSIDQASAGLYESRYIERFLNVAVNLGHHPEVAPILASMTLEPAREIKAIAARQIAVASFHNSDLDSDVDEFLRSGVASIVAAVVGVFAENVTTQSRHDRILSVISSAFNSEHKDVRISASRAFGRLDGESLGGYEELFEAFSKSVSIAEDGVFSALRTLNASRMPLPVVALDMCEAFVQVNRESIGDIASGVSTEAGYVVQVALRIRAQFSGPDIQRRCLDLIDELVVAGAHDIENQLDLIER